MVLLATSLVGEAVRADDGDVADKDATEEAQRIVGILAPVGPFKVAHASRNEYMLNLLDAHGMAEGLLVLRMGTPDRLTRFHSRRFTMEIWNISPNTDVVDRLVQAARAVARWDGPQVDQPIHTGTEQLDEMIQVAVIAVLLAMGMGLARRGRISFDWRLPHVLQVIAQGSIFIYWGLYWPGVLEHLPAMAIQLILAYAADAFFCFAKFKSWRIGLSAVPVVFSINLFEWFDWHAAFIGIVFAFAAKAYIHRKGRHIFNPSVIGLTIVGVISIFVPDFVHFASAFHTLNIPPNMAEWVLIAALLPQTRYRILPISIGAMLALESTGNPALVRPAIILGFTLLASDPATTPQSDIGKVLFGAVVGFGLPVFSVIMRRIGQPDDFAKVMSVAVGNFLAPSLDVLAANVVALSKRAAEFVAGRVANWHDAVPGLVTRLRAELGRREVPNSAFVVVWLVLCVSLLATEKPRDFEPSLHWNWGTPLVSRNADDVPRCEENPVFCRPFSFVDEASLWLKRGRSGVATADVAQHAEK